MRLINSFRRKVIISSTTKTKPDLKAQIAGLQDENQDLQDQLDAIADIVTPADEEEDEDESELDDGSDEEEEEEDDAQD